MTGGQGMASTRTVHGKCQVCGLESDHDIVAMKADGIGFCFGLECPSCGTLVPEQAWQKYQRTGDIVVPNLFKGKASETRMKAKPGRYI